MRARGLWCAVGLLVVLSGCGADQAGSPKPTPAASSTGAGDVLSIVFHDGKGPATTWRLTCNPPGGDHPDPATACRVLKEKGAEALPAVPKGRMCTQIYGGPQTATITGTWLGKPVSSRLSRVNGCETSRWQALVGLLPKPVATR
jgi:hypothetical protein